MSDGKYTARPKNDAHVYHTDKESTARVWQERDGLDVTPEVEPHEEGTLGHYLYSEE